MNTQSSHPLVTAQMANTMAQLGLQTAPVLFLYPPTVGPHAAASPDPIRYDFTSG
jgi:oligosaccharyltransferase complex subunit gamma